MAAGKENGWEAEARIAFPVAAVCAVVPVLWALPPVNSELALGRGAWEREPSS